jgi:hypothetical protein
LPAIEAVGRFCIKEVLFGICCSVARRVPINDADVRVVEISEDECGTFRRSNGWSRSGNAPSEQHGEAFLPEVIVMSQYVADAALAHRMPLWNCPSLKNDLGLCRFE